MALASLNKGSHQRGGNTRGANCALRRLPDGAARNSRCGSPATQPTPRHMTTNQGTHGPASQYRLSSPSPALCAWVGAGRCALVRCVPTIPAGKASSIRTAAAETLAHLFPALACEAPMARSSTSFGGPRGNKPNAGDGNKLALRHGAYSPDEVALRLPGIRARVMAELAQVPYLTAPDSSLVERYVFLVGQAEVMEDYYVGLGGFLNESGKAHPSVSLYTALVHRIEGLAKVLGLGPNPRTQVLQGMANTGKELVLIKAAQEKARARLLDG